MAFRDDDLQGAALAGGELFAGDGELFGSDHRSVRMSSAEVRVSAVIPARNEARNLAYVFGRLPADLHQLVLVDGHSSDDTVAEARRLRPDVEIIHQRGRGKGDALSAGFAACTGNVIAMLDADGSTDPREIPRFLAALCAGADFVKGSRYAQGGGSSDLTPPRRVGNALLCWLVNTLYGTSYTDLCYGYNAFWRRCLPYIRLDVPGFEVETLINVRIARAGLVVHEVPSFERPRLEGTSNLKAVRDGLQILRTIGLERLRVSHRHTLRRHGETHAAILTTLLRGVGTG
jgi:glycosyltransferase involved in cell wall biosynthesis